MKRLIVLTMVVALTGCALGTPKVQEIANYPGKSLLLSSDAAQVSIDEKEYTRLDDSTSDGGPTLKSIWSTGALWKRAFIGDPTGVTVRPNGARHFRRNGATLG